jgi:hypothetical protein
LQRLAVGMNKQVSAVAIQTLKEALCSIYWYKADLRSFLQNCLSDKSLVGSANWDGYKRQVASDIVDALCSNQEKYLGDIRRLFHEVGKMDNFRHEQLDDGSAKAERARRAVQDLRHIISAHDTVVSEEQHIEDRRKEAAEKLQKSKAVLEKLEDIRSRYMNLVTSTSPQQRGFELEKILYDMFDLFDLDPKASFRNTGEQIDGALSLEGTDYLFEAKWHKEITGIQDLDAFAGKVRRRLENTLGLFLSINDYSEDAVRGHSSGQAVIFLMIGADLMAVLEGRIDFISLLLRKRRHAAQTGEILLRIHEIIRE